MRKILFAAGALAATTLLFNACATKNAATQEVSKPYEVLTYVYSGGDVLPDPSLVTTINYAFATLNDEHDGFILHNEDRLRQIVDLKKVNPDLKVLLSMGGNSKQGFPEMAADSAKRNSLAGQCARVIEEYNLDGIDWDWEFPCAEGGTPDDYSNYKKVLRAVRDSIGPDKLQTLAAGGDLAGLGTENVAAMLELLDYVNVMAYDLGGQSPWHHTALYRYNAAGDSSVNVGWRSVDEVVEDYVNHGVPFEKMMLGLGFYGRGDDNYYTGWTSTEQAKPYGNLTEQWDSIACVPYIADSTGVLVCGYENPRSIEIKCDYIKEKGFRGAMCWRTELDLDSLVLARVVARCLLETPNNE